ncbi:MAG: hypothetical protein QXQ81_05315 [Candidatus Thorarchaeota archaeon]
MRILLRVDERWLQLERRWMKAMQARYKSWELVTLKQMREAKDLRSLRELFYQLGDRWEWGQATGTWLSEEHPLDAVGIVLRIPGLEDHRERYVVYAIMAYSRGVTRKFDHLGDKERVIIERDLSSGRMRAWSTTGHGAVDLVPTDLSQFRDIREALSSCSLVAQPGDHALRIEIPLGSPALWSTVQLMWSIANGLRGHVMRHMEVLENLEDDLGFEFGRFARSVIELERVWHRLKRQSRRRWTWSARNEYPPHIAQRDRQTLRVVEGLLHLLWFRPPAYSVKLVKRVVHELESEPTPTAVQRDLVGPLKEVRRSLVDVLERAKYIKWKSVIEGSELEQELFAGLGISRFAQEAFATALEDILKEHSLAYVGYPERMTARGKVVRFVFGTLVLPVRLFRSALSAFMYRLDRVFRALGTGTRSGHSDAGTAREHQPTQPG